MTQRWWVSKTLMAGLCALFFVSFLSAQETESDAEAAEVETEAVEAEVSPAAENNTPRRSAADDLDTFVPSEEVSSDLSVSFPVDI